MRWRQAILHRAAPIFLLLSVFLFFPDNPLYATPLLSSHSAAPGRYVHRPSNQLPTPTSNALRPPPKTRRESPALRPRRFLLLMSEALLPTSKHPPRRLWVSRTRFVPSKPSSNWRPLVTQGAGWRSNRSYPLRPLMRGDPRGLQGFLAHKKQPPPRARRFVAGGVIAGRPAPP